MKADNIIVEKTGHYFRDMPTYDLKIAVGKEWLLTKGMLSSDVDKLTNTLTELKKPAALKVEKLFSWIIDLPEVKPVPRQFSVSRYTELTTA